MVLGSWTSRCLTTSIVSLSALTLLTLATVLPRVCFKRDLLFFFFNDPATTEIYTLSLHDALPISGHGVDGVGVRDRGHAFRLADARALQHAFREHLSLDGSATIVGMEVPERGTHVVDDQIGRAHV